MAENDAPQIEAPSLPYEQGNEAPPKSGADALSDLLDDDPDFGVGDTQEEGGSAPTADDEGDEPEDDDVDELEEVLDDEDDDSDPAEEDDDADGDDEEPDAEPDDRPKYKVKVQGEEVEVTLDELLSGYSRTADYTRKTTEVAEQRKAVEAEAEKIRVAREEYGQKLEAVKQALEQQGPEELSADQWDSLRKRDPGEFAARWAEKQQYEQQKQLLAQEQNRVATEAQKDQQKRLEAILATERVKLFEAIPEWKDDEVAAQEKAELKEYAEKEYGYTEDDLDQIYDHRLMVIIRKAQKFDQISKKKGSVDEKRQAKKVLAPGGKKAKAPKKGKKAQRQREQKLARSGRVDDAAAVLMGMLDD